MATDAENGEKKATVALFCVSVDRALLTVQQIVEHHRDLSTSTARRAPEIEFRDSAHHCRRRRNSGQTTTSAGADVAGVSRAAGGHVTEWTLRLSSAPRRSAIDRSTNPDAEPPAAPPVCRRGNAILEMSSFIYTAV